MAVGGTSLLLLGLIDRPTRDLDVVATVEAGRYHALPDLPSPLAEAVRDVGEVMGIGPNWLNSGPAGLLDFGLPEGFAERAEIRSYGALTLHVASRVDQIALKLYAAARPGLDQQAHGGPSRPDADRERAADGGTLDPNSRSLPRVSPKSYEWCCGPWGSMTICEL